ncbi:MAG: NAD(P)/FAD-dependent oxidoreductase [Planctomycetota bacterium]
MEVRVRRRSLDARRKPRVRIVLVVDVALSEGVSPSGRITPAPPEPDDPLSEGPLGTESLRGPVAVVGTGPAGLSAALGLARMGYRPIVFERGRPVPARVKDLDRFWVDRELDPESNLLFGEGGAGAFSDGKLKTRIGDPLLSTFLGALVESGAPDSVLIEANAHLGTDGVREVSMGLRRLAEEAGASFAFESKLEDFVVRDGRIVSIRVGGKSIEVGAVLLAIGGSARDTFALLEAKGIPLEAKPFQLGLRMEHPQALIDRMQYGTALDRFRLPPAEYRFTVKLSTPLPSIFTFCMCPGGTVVPAVSEPGGLCTNGMSFSQRNGRTANAAVVMTVHPEKSSSPLSGVTLQRRVERDGFIAGGGDYTAPAQTLSSFLEGSEPGELPESTFPFGVHPAPLAPLFEPLWARALHEGLTRLCGRHPDLAHSPALLLGPETRGSSPVRILRDREMLESPGAGCLYPAGEGAGYAGGIASAGVDGLRVALALSRRFAPPP